MYIYPSDVPSVSTLDVSAVGIALLHQEGFIIKQAYIYVKRIV